MPLDTRKAAFFDIDNTLLDTKSMFSFQAFYLDCWLPQQGRARESFASFKSALESHAQHADRKALNRAFYAAFEGLIAQDVAEAARAWFASLARTRGASLWIKPATELARALKSRGHLLVAVSGSTQAILQPVLDGLGFDHCLATQLEAQDGRFTGRILGVQMIGEGKGEAVKAFAERNGIDLASSSACGDHITDLSMLESVGHPWVVTGDPILESIAIDRNWPLLHAMSEDSHQACAHT